jgi:hypothetical protein
MPKFENSYIWVKDFIAEEYRPSEKIKFPFNTVFASDPVTVFLPQENDINIAKAGIDSLKPFLDSSIDLERNYDMIGVAFNAFVVNRANKNGQVISTEVALSSVENFKFKPMNIEHKRKNVAGLITGYGFSEYGTDKPLTLEEVKSKKDPFNVVLSGFVWRIVNEEFAEKLEASSDPSSDNYLSISTSWEMGFKNFNIAKGSLNLSEASIFSEEEDVSKMKNKLAHFGGNGIDEDGQPLYINLIGDVLPLGIGFTTNPAADVKGVKVFDPQDNNNEVDAENNLEFDNNDDKISINNKVIESSQLSKTPVETNINIISNKLDSEELAASNNFEQENKKKENKKMLIKSIEDLNDDSLKQICATDVRALFEEEIKKASEKFAEEQAAKDSLLAEAEKTKAELEAQLEELKHQLKAELEKIKLEAEAREAQEVFQNRMSSLDEEFSLDDEERQVIGEQIKDLDQESFEKWYKAFNVFAKSKNKKLMMEKKEAEEEALKKQEGLAESEKEQSAEVIASEQEEKELEAASVLEKAEVEDIALPNGAVAEDSLRQKYAKAFNSDTIKIQIK